MFFFFVEITEQIWAYNDDSSADSSNLWFIWIIKKEKD